MLVKYKWMHVTNHYWIKVFMLHLGICIVYLGLTSYELVVGKDPEMGVAMQQVACIILHLLITTMILAFIWTPEAKKRGWVNIFVLHLGAISLWVGLFMVFNIPLSDWLWSLR